ncbi:MAG: hypothetical protein Kow0080_17120 [Candidatus Promineifilaceae bacterium]
MKTTSDKQTKQILFVAVLLTALFALVLPVGAQTVDTSAITDDQVNEVAKDLYCPVCESTPLDVCATKACAEWRELIREKLAQGETKEEIFAYFARQYGAGVLAEPPAQGVYLFLWIFPILAVVIGGVFFARYMNNLRAQEAEAVPEATAVTPPTPPAEADDYLAKVEEELRKQ